LELAEKNYQEGAALMKTGAPTPAQLLLNMNAVSLPPSARTPPSGTLETRFSALRDAKLTPCSRHAADKLDFDHVLELLGTALHTKYGLSSFQRMWPRAQQLVLGWRWWSIDSPRL
jgi:hypothetical protein